MQITITEREIHAALRKYIIARLRLSATEEIKVDLMATRGVDGFKAMLDIIEPEEGENTFVMPSTVFTPEVGIRTPVLQFSAEPVKESTTADADVANIVQ